MQQTTFSDTFFLGTLRVNMELSMGEKNFVELDKKPADLVLHHFLKKVKKKFCKQCAYYIGQIWWFCLARP